MQVKRFVKQLGNELMDDNVTDVGAMMAYYAVLALFPMLVFVLSLALLVLADNTVREGVSMASATLPPSVRDADRDARRRAASKRRAPASRSSVRRSRCGARRAARSR